MKKVIACVLTILVFVGSQLAYAEDKQTCTCGYDLCGDNLEGQVVGDKDKTKCSCVVETSKLKNCVSKKKSEQAAVAVTEDSKDSNFWGAVGLKSWQNTLKVGSVDSKSNTVMFSGTVGYAKVFFNFSLNGWSTYNDPNTSGAHLDHGQGSFNLGYLVSPEFSLAVGRKLVQENVIINGVNNSLSGGDSTPWYTTLGAVYNHKFTDVPFSFNGNITYGKRGAITVNCGAACTGATAINSSTYLGYEIGGSYYMTNVFAVNLFYRVEQWDALVPTYTTVPNVDLAVGKLKARGPGVGASYAF